MKMAGGYVLPAPCQCSEWPDSYLLQYHKYRNGRYPIPNDDVEQNRDDMKHAMMLELTESVHRFVGSICPLI